MITTPISQSKKESGAALVTAIFAILLVTLIGTAMHYMATISLTIAVNDRDNVEAFYIADAGIQHAKTLVSKVEKSKYSLILKTGANPLPNTGDELSVPPSTGLWAPSESIPSGDATAGGVTKFGAGGDGRYWVAVKNDTATGETPTTDSNGILIVTSTGVGRNGATAVVEITVKALPSSPAVLINGKAEITGNVKVSGPNGILHANDTLLIGGNPCADQYFSTSKDVINPSKLLGGGCTGSGVIRTYQSIVEPPIYNIRNDFYGKTDYILGANGADAGKVFSGSGILISDTTKNSNKWVINGSTWTWYPSKMLWEISGNSMPDASFYSEGNIEISGNFGSLSKPALVSFIAEGYITNSGKQYMTAKYNDFSLVAGTDLKISGKLTESSGADVEIRGINYAYHQINFSGGPTFVGKVIAANQADTASPGGTNLVPLEQGYMKISGNPTVIGSSVGSGMGATVHNWREVRR